MTRRFEQPIRVVSIEVPTAGHPSLASQLAESDYPRFRCFEVSQITDLREGGKLPFEPDCVLLDVGSQFGDASYTPEEAFAEFQLTFCFFRRIPLILVAGEFDVHNIDYDLVYSAVFTGADNVYYKEMNSVEILSLFVVKSLARAQRLASIDKHISEAWATVAHLKEQLLDVHAAPHM